MYVSNTNMLFLSFGVAFFVFLVAIPLSIMFEAPFMNLEKIFLTPRKKEVKVEVEKGALKENLTI